MRDSLLLVNDVTGYGRVSTFAMLPILTQYGLHPYILPTALVSNTLDYGTSETLDTTDFMQSAIAKWDELGFSFDCISTGFITNDRQVPIILDLIHKQDKPFVFVDPIMADDGKLYPDMYPGAIECNRQLASVANIIMPNITEAKILTGLFEDKDILSDDECQELIDALRAFGPEKLVIKGCEDHDGNTFNLIYDADNGGMIKLPYQRINTSFIGTGDLFSAVLIAEYMSGSSLTQSVQAAADFIRAVILDNMDAEDHFDIHFEKTLSELRK
ncbi:MAG: PfkB family carbohydrate kinase [Firmicutes bacterium]|nr:PfkB family carbohydrate kinase [Bacillota bacterium]